MIDDDDGRRQLAALHAVVRVLAESETVSSAFDALLPAICTGIGWDVGAVWTPDPSSGVLCCRGFWSQQPCPDFEARSRSCRLPPGVGLPGRVWSSGVAVGIIDVVEDANFPRASSAAADGLHGAFAVPIRIGADIFAVLEFLSREVHVTSDEMLRTMDTIGTQIGLFVQRALAWQEVRDGELRKTAILEASLDCIVTIDHAGKIVEINPAFERVFGRRGDALVGNDLAAAIIPPDLRAAHFAGLARCVATGAGPVLGRRLELTATRADGTRFPVEVTVTRIPRIEPPMFTGTLRDLTEVHRTESELRRAARRFETILGCTRGIVFEFDDACRYVNIWTNDESLLIRPRADLLGKTINEVLGPEDAQPFNERIRRVSASGRGESFEYSLDVLGGKRWFLADAFVAPPVEAREPSTVVFHVRDNTERKLQQLRLEIRSEIERAVLAARSSVEIGQTVDRLRELVPFVWTCVVHSGVTPELAAELMIDDAGAIPPALQARVPEGACSLIAVPLVFQAETIGVLVVGSDRPAAFTQSHLELCREVAGPIAIGIQQALLRERLQVLSRRLITTQEAERRDLARELHDEFGQVLSGLKLLLETAARVPLEQALERISEARLLIDDLTGSVRALSRGLRPAILDEGIVPSLEACFDRFTSNVEVHFEHSIAGRRFAPEIEIAVYRIAQEALTNSIRHAHARCVTVRLSVEGAPALPATTSGGEQRGPEAARQLERLRIQIEDDGVGFDPAAIAGSGGLSGMEERATLLGGRLSIESQRGAGTRVSGELPLSEPGTARA